MPLTANPLTGIEVRPRRVSTSVILSAFFGGKVVQSCWVLSLVALVPLWYCAAHESFHPLGVFALLGPTEQVTGYVSDLDVLEETDMGDGGARDAFGVEGPHMIRQTISRITYSYSGPDGRSHTGIARVGIDDGEYCEIGAPVTLTYAAYNPAMSRVEGLRINWASTASFTMIGFWVFLAGSLWLVYPIAHGFNRGFRASRLLQCGRMAQGRLGSEKPRSLLGLYNVTDVTHSFQVDGRACTSTRVRVDDVKESPAETEAIFFDENDPKIAVVLSDIPGGAILGDSGQITEGVGNGYNCLCVPMLCAFAYGWFTLHMLDIVGPPSLSLISA